MNNKGFAITTILYGIMILFCILLVSLLGLLASYKKTQNLLVDNTNGTRDIVKVERFEASDKDKDLEGFCSKLADSKSYRIVFCDDDDDDSCVYKHVSDVCP